jgi:hypothetical protein
MTSILFQDGYTPLHPEQLSPTNANKNGKIYRFAVTNRIWAKKIKFLKTRMSIPGYGKLHLVF